MALERWDAGWHHTGRMLGGMQNGTGCRTTADRGDAGQDVRWHQTGRVLAGMLGRMRDGTRQVGCETAWDARGHRVTMTRRALAPL